MVIILKIAKFKHSFKNIINFKTSKYIKIYGVKISINNFVNQK